VQWLNTAPAAELLQLAILSDKRGVTQTKLALRQSRNRGTNAKQKRDYSVLMAGAAGAVFSYTSR